MELQHFSHEHPLRLIEAKVLQPKEKYVGFCYGCSELITSEDSDVYFCTQCEGEGKFFLHKSCVELPLEISHPMHQQHSLFLHQRPLYYYGCDVCGQSWEGFTYNCFLCNFNADIMCVLRDQNLLSTIPSCQLNHKSHDHPLIFQPRPALFFCNPCGTEDRDQSYICANESCLFWIHKSCALLPEIIESNHHNHPLSLAYSFPSEYGHLRLNCDFCHKSFFPGYWVYQCLRCRYFVHAKCTDTSKETAQAETTSNLCHNSEDKSTVKLPGNDFFAMSNIFGLLIRYFLEKYGPAQELFSEIKHFSHVHPLILSVGNQPDVKEMKYEEAMICDGCILPICDSYYSCENCNYFLHASCAQLPKEFQHPSHLEHPLVLRKLRRSFSYLKCSFCDLICNGFLYNCEDCGFRLDLKCAILNTVSVIMHEAHPHQLHNICPSYVECNGCQRIVYKNDRAFGCENCSFFLHYNCILLPRNISHFDSFRIYKRDNHHLTLMYRLCSEDPQEFCVICEEEIHPKYWFYHCSDCDGYFHSYCIVELEKYRNIKFGAAVQVLNHTHAVKLIIRVAFTPFCACCDGDLYCQMAFECGDCNYYLCYSCGINSSTDIGDEDSNSVSEDESKAHNSIMLPMKDNSSSELIRCFLKQHGIAGSQLLAEIKHFSHDHPLNLSINNSEYVKALKNEEILICDGCIRLISDPYYSCKKCNYFLHAYCAQLPDEIQQPLHSQHSLVLSKQLLGYKYCKFCSSLCNGFLFKCKENCDFHLDVHCAILTANNFIKHEAHCHQLLPTKVSFDSFCNGCHRDIFGGGALSCVDCNSHLDFDCAVLPRFVKHVKDEHSLVLNCHSTSHHRKVIYCENCKEKIYTIYWFYNCLECNRSFHPRCIPELGYRLQNMKFGIIVQIKKHSHVVKFVKKDVLINCNHCRAHMHDKVAYECEPCGYCICVPCAESFDSEDENVEETPGGTDTNGSSST